MGNTYTATELTRRWMLNNEGLFNDLRAYKRKYGVNMGADELYKRLQNDNCLVLPDGTVMTKTGIKNAMRAA